MNSTCNYITWTHKIPHWSSQWLTGKFFFSLPPSFCHIYIYENLHHLLWFLTRSPWDLWFLCNNYWNSACKRSRFWSNDLRRLLDGGVCMLIVYYIPSTWCELYFQIDGRCTREWSRVCVCASFKLKELLIKTTHFIIHKHK